MSALIVRHSSHATVATRNCQNIAIAATPTLPEPETPG